MRKMAMRNMTKHAELRIKQRRIPVALILEAKEYGRRTVIADRNSVEYRLKNVLGVRGLTLVVITDEKGKVITSYVKKMKRSC